MISRGSGLPPKKYVRTSIPWGVVSATQLNRAGMASRTCFGADDVVWDECPAACRRPAAVPKSAGVASGCKLLMDAVCPVVVGAVRRALLPLPAG